MTLKEAFNKLPNTIFIQRKSRPETGSYEVKWIQQLLDYKIRDCIFMGSFIRKFIAEDAKADDWEVVTEYPILKLKYGIVKYPL